jgi:hypothetical protein
MVDLVLLLFQLLIPSIDLICVQGVFDIYCILRVVIQTLELSQNHFQMNMVSVYYHVFGL